MTDIKSQLAELNPDILFADGFDGALVGTVTIFNKTIACYDRLKCIQILIRRDNMTYEEAEEFFEFNVVGSFMGENTPAFFEPSHEA